MSLESRLAKILDNVNYWLNYAELKNGGILACNLALFAISASLLNSVTNEAMGGKIVYLLFVFANGVSMAIILASFIPVNAAHSIPKKTPNPNLAFYRDIACYCSGNAYIGDLMGSSEYEASPTELHFATEAVINSRIAVRKFKFGTCGIVLLFVSLIALTVVFFFCCLF